MKTPLQITWREIDQSDAVEAVIREKVAKLEHFCDEILSCRVVVDEPHRHQHKGRHFQITVDLSVPGNEIIARRSPNANGAHEDVYVAIRDIFEEATRQLKNYVRKRRGDVKAHSRTQSFHVDELTQPSEADEPEVFVRESAELAPEDQDEVQLRMVARA